MSIFFIATLILFGIALIVLEILIVPGLIVGIAGGIFMLMGFIWTWKIYGQTTGILVVSASLLVLGLILYISFKAGLWKRFGLKDKLTGRMNVVDKNVVKEGDRGSAISSLRPMGTVRINGHRFEASTEGEMIPPNYPVEVLRVETNKLIVKAVRSVSL